MRIDLHNQLESLQKSALELQEKITADLLRTKSELQKFESDEAKKQWAGDFLKLQIEQAKKQAKDRAVGYKTALRETRAKVESLQKAWTTESLARRLAREPVDGEAAVVHEIRLLRLNMAAKDAITPADFLPLIEEATATKNVAGALLLGREAARRSGVDGMVLKTAVDDALESLIPVNEQVVANRFIDAAALHVDFAEDANHELEHGEESMRGKMHRITRQQREREQDDRNKKPD